MSLRSNKPALPVMLSIAALLLMPVAAPAADEAAIARVETYLAATKTLHAEFSQEMIDDRGRVLAASEGTMSIRRPGRFRWHYSAPEELLVLGDGEKIWSYDVELDNVTVASQDDALAGNPAALLAGDGSVNEAFVAVKSWRSDEIDWVELRPRREQQDFRSVRLGFDGDTLAAMELLDQLGQTTRIVFDKVEQNATLDDAVFVFSLPEGVDVISAGGLKP